MDADVSDRHRFVGTNEVQGRKIQIPRHQEGTGDREVQAQNREIPSMVTRLIKRLGKWVDAFLHDLNNVRKLEQQLEDGLKKIDHWILPGKFKIWLYQHALLPRLIWRLMLYEVPSTTVQPCFKSIGLYGKTNELQLPIFSLVEEFKIAKTRLVLTLRNSPELIREAGIEPHTSRKWSATESCNQAENSLKHKDIVGVTTV